MSKCIKCGDEKDPAIYDSECICIICIMEDREMIRIAANAVMRRYGRKKCYVCHEIRETRPYGEDNKNICHPCMMAGPKRQATARRIIDKRLRPSGVVIGEANATRRPIDVREDVSMNHTAWPCACYVQQQTHPDKICGMCGGFVR